MNIGVGDGFADLAIDFEDADSDQLRRIVKVELKKFLELFSRRNREYRGDHAPNLGPRGEFPDIYRKVGLLRTAVWDGMPELLRHEDVEEVLWDIIGHCLLMADKLSQESGNAAP